MKTALKKATLKLLESIGYELRPLGERASLEGVLRHAHRAGLAPRTVFDVGAAHGDFSQDCAGVFPQARYLLFEPLEEFQGDLERVCGRIADSHHYNMAAAATVGETVINVHSDLVGSSFYLENEDSDVNGVPRTIPTTTLDAIAEAETPVAPFLIKVDVQGAEMDVLEGARGVLAKTQMVILEVTFFEFFRSAPQFAEVISRMESLGFVVYDIFGLSHRPLDGALAQADVVFVPEGSAFRTHHHYATPAQREATTRRLQAKRSCHRSKE